MNNPTIRTMSGASLPKGINASSSALLVIDFQNEYFDGRMPLSDGTRALRNAQRLIAHADKAKIPVFHIQHVNPAGSPVFAEGSISSAFHRDMQPGPQHTVLQKSSVSVFPTTDLDRRLRAAHIDTLIIIGLMTHACVAGAARDAVSLGYSIIVVEDACATRDLDSFDGVSPGVTHNALHLASLASIDDTFGDILTTEQLLDLPLL